ncbi:MAG TPA: hypothetical protein VMS02_07620 [Solirubrobacteraceae bacterium]|nr:hypothetical protein [Solirubrobacteraceae bacterium]
MAASLRALPWPARALLVVLSLAIVEALLLGGHLLHGGLYTDDWAWASIEHQEGISGLFNSLSSANRERPLGEIYGALTQAISGTNPHLHALWGLLTLLAAVSCLYLLLRMLSLRVRDALAIALLFMLFPFGDSGWLWYAASYSYLAIALAALGAALALVGLRHRGWAAVAAHGGAMLLFAASVLTYQLAAGVICLSLLMYLPRTTRRQAVALWLLDVGTVALAAIAPRLITGSAGAIADPIIPVSEQVTHAKLMADQGLTLLTAALVPFRGPHRNVVLPVALLIACAGGALAWRLGDAEPALRRRLLRWLLLVAIGGLVIAAAYAVYVPAPINLYQPLGKGEENRVNVLASLGYALIVYGLAMTLATSVLRLLRRRPAWVPALGLALVALVLVGYVRRVRQDVNEWNRAGTLQRQELAELRAAVRPPAGATIYTFGGVGATAPDVYVFRETWDLNGAVQLLWNEAALRGYPIFTGTQMSCAATQVVPVGPSNGDGIDQAASYGQAVFYDFATGRMQRIDNAAQCARAVAAFVPGPVEA